MIDGNPPRTPAEDGAFSAWLRHNDKFIQRADFDAWLEQAFIDGLRSSTAASAARIAELQVKFDKLSASFWRIEQYAARYRWLRDSSANQWENPLVVTQSRVGESMKYVGPLIGDKLDADIDAAIAAIANKERA